MHNTTPKFAFSQITVAYLIFSNFYEFSIYLSITFITYRIHTLLLCDNEFHIREYILYIWWCRIFMLTLFLFLFLVGCVFPNTTLREKMTHFRIDFDIFLMRMIDARFDLRCSQVNTHSRPGQNKIGHFTIAAASLLALRCRIVSTIAWIIVRVTHGIISLPQKYVNIEYCHY